MLAVVQLKLGGPTNNLIQTVRKHVATSLEVVADHLIVNKAVATIVKSEVWGGGGKTAICIINHMTMITHVLCNCGSSVCMIDC